MHNTDARGESTVMAHLSLSLSCMMMDGMSRRYEEETY
jgi:hypothetical protein